MSLEIRRSADLPAGLERLVAAAEAEGFGFVGRLDREWRSGALRFAAPGEFLLQAWEDGQLAGVGGLTADPFAEEPGVGRVRRVHVLPDSRGRGVGRALVQEIVRRARGGFATLRVRSHEAGPFYEALGFRRTSEPETTHRLDLRVERA